MPRYARMLIPDEKAVYHMMSRTALDGFPFGDLEKDEFVRILKLFSKLYFTEIIGFSALDNHVPYHIQTGNRDKFLSLDFGLKEFGVRSTKERLKDYKKFVYETGAADTGKGAKIKAEIVEEERSSKLQGVICSDNVQGILRIRVL